jgi:hypothetical protein
MIARPERAGGSAPPRGVLTMRDTNGPREGHISGSPSPKAHYRGS